MCDMIERLTAWQKEQPKVAPPAKMPADRMHLRNADLDKVHAKWADHELLRGVPERHAKVVAVILDGMKRWLGELSPTPEFRSYALEVAAKVLRGFVPLDLVSVQPLLSPGGLIFVSRFRVTESGEINLQIEDEDILARTRKIVTFTDNLKVGGKIDPDLLAVEIRKQITKEILTDIDRNVGTRTKKRVASGHLNLATIAAHVIEVSGVIHRKTLMGGADWLVVSPSIGNKMFAKGVTTGVDIDALGEVTRVGSLDGRHEVYVDPDMAGHKILCGAYHADKHYPGYIYSPYIFFSETPGLNTPDFSTLPGLISRYGKKLMREGLWTVEEKSSEI